MSQSSFPATARNCFDDDDDDDDDDNRLYTEEEEEEEEEEGDQDADPTDGRARRGAGGGAGGIKTLSIAAWLADLHPSFAKYASALTTMGCTDTTLLPLLTSQHLEQISATLERSGALQLQRDTIMAALQQATGGGAKRARKN